MTFISRKSFYICWLKVLNPSKMKKKLFLLAAALGVAATQGVTQDSTRTYGLGEAQIAVARIDLKVKNLGRDIKVLTADDWPQWPVNTLDEVLRLTAGVETQNRGMFGNQADISIWGSTFNQVLILLDGNRVNDPLTGHFNSYIPIALSEVARIEIIKGASSGIYGSEAVGGVINIVSHAFDGSQTEHQASAEISAGDFGLMNVNAGGQFNTDDIHVSFGVDHSNADGHLAEGDSIPYGFENTRYSASASGQIGSKVNIALGTSFDTRDFGARYFYTQSTYDLSEEKVTRQFNRGRIVITENDKHKTTLSGAYQKSTDYFLFNPLFAANEHTTSHSEVNLFHRAHITPQVQLTMGGHYLSQSVISSDRGDHEYRNMAGYALAHKTFGQNVNLSAGVRIDNNASGTSVTPQLSTSWVAAENLTLRFAAGQAARSADVTERYVSTNLEGPVSSGRNLGNPNLANEKSMNLELGGEYWINQGAIRFTAFSRQSTDLIDFVLTPSADITGATNILDSAEYFYAQNIAALTTYGLDLSFWRSFAIGENVKLNTEVSYLMLSFDRPSDEISKYIANSAKNLVKVNLGLNWKKFNLSIAGLYKERQEAEAEQINKELANSYLVVDANASYEFWSDHGSVFVKCYNVSDLDYSDILGATLPGRWLMGGLKFEF